MGLVFAFEAHIFPLADYQAKDVQRLSYGFVIFVETRCICRVRALPPALLQQLLQQAWESAKNLQKQELLALTWRGLEGFLSTNLCAAYFAPHCSKGSTFLPYWEL